MEGFSAFVVQHSEALLSFIGLRDEQQALRHLAEHDTLIDFRCCLSCCLSPVTCLVFTETHSYALPGDVNKSVNAGVNTQSDGCICDGVVL